MKRPVAVLVVAALAGLAGCSSIGLGVTIPIGPVGVTIGGSVPLPQPASPSASAPDPK